jgi:hypothetical protein
MADVCRNIGPALDEVSQQLLRAVLEKSRHRTARAYACGALAEQAEYRLLLARRFKNQLESPNEYEGIIGKAVVEKIVKADPDKLSKEAERYYEQIIKEYADVSDLQGGTIGKAAEGRVEALRNPVLLGKAAPEIAGEDIDGTKFKLSDYRGKVVLLDFWGNW